jgi:sugar phosphate isomerase/epimerase
MMGIEKAKTRAFVCYPFHLLTSKYLPRVLEDRINPEIGLNGGALDTFEWPAFRQVAGVLGREGLACTIHAPFTDLSIGAIDGEVRRITVERLKRSLDVAALFRAESLVCHSGFDQRHYFGAENRWMDNAFLSLRAILDHARPLGIPIMLENVFEPTPAIHKELLGVLGSPLFGFCLDIGHQEVFSKTRLDEWLENLGEHLGQLHLHDNRGYHDEHLPIGKGILDFDRLFSFLHSQGKSPIITLEPHKEDDVLSCLEGLDRLLAKYPLQR